MHDLTEVETGSVWHRGHCMFSDMDWHMRDISTHTSSGKGSQNCSLICRNTTIIHRHTHTKNHINITEIGGYIFREYHMILRGLLELFGCNFCVKWAYMISRPTQNLAKFLQNCSIQSHYIKYLFNIFSFQ